MRVVGDLGISGRVSGILGFFLLQVVSGLSGFLKGLGDIWGFWESGDMGNRAGDFWGFREDSVHSEVIWQLWATRCSGDIPLVMLRYQPGDSVNLGTGEIVPGAAKGKPWGLHPVTLGIWDSEKDVYYCNPFS